jgi:hypothetical protein
MTGDFSLAPGRSHRIDSKILLKQGAVLVRVPFPITNIKIAS